MHTINTRNEPNYRYGHLIAALTLIALVLRIPTLITGLWLDECITLFECTRPTWIEMINDLKLLEATPPLFLVIERIFVQAFGTGEITARLPSLIAGLLLIPSVYWLGKTVQSRQVGVIAAFFVAFSPLANFYACQARSYSLAMLLSALTLAIFYRLIFRPDLNVAARVGLFVFFMTALLYSNTLGVVLHVSLAVATAILLARQYLQSKTAPDHPGEIKAEASHRSGAESRLPSLTALLIAFSLPPMFFMPWVPVILSQLAWTKWMPPTPLSQFPLVVSYSFTMFTPLPIWLGFLLTCGTPLYLLVKFLLRLKGGFAGAIEPLIRLKTMSREIIILLCATFIPCAIVGYLAPFQLGYFRYVLPFAPGGWTLIAIGLSYCFRQWSHVKAGTSLDVPEVTPESDKSKSSKQHLIPLTLLLIAVADVAYVLIFDLKDHPDNSGLRVMARAVRAGHLDNCAICLAPDISGPTLCYYLSDKDIKDHNLFICGFVRWQCKDPCSPMALERLWRPADAASKTMELIAKLPGQGHHKLALTSDIYCINTKAAPKQDRVNELTDRIWAKYALIDTAHYQGLAETMNVTTFDLDQAAPAKQLLQLAKRREERKTGAAQPSH